ncbi:MAG: hypothetical protein ACREHC_02405 [Candidatus Levyibacteriota bacterium]
MSTDYVAQSIEDAITWIKNYSENPEATKIKDFSVMEHCIDTFTEKFPKLASKYKNNGW